jgi:hypothetical protein
MWLSFGNCFLSGKEGHGSLSSRIRADNLLSIPRLTSWIVRFDLPFAFVKRLWLDEDSRDRVRFVSCAVVNNSDLAFITRPKLVSLANGQLRF